jgi:hypothetical protein
LGQMVSMSFKASQVMSQSKFMTIVIFIQKVSIVWLIALIWYYFFWVCNRWWNLKFSYKPCIPILQIHLRRICSSQSWLNSWKQEKKNSSISSPWCHGCSWDCVSPILVTFRF